MPPRVLIDATAVPADRGGVGRYLDNLLRALSLAGADLAVACQRADAERYGALAGVTVVPAPAAVAHRPARLAWEQTGLPLVADSVGADVLHSPHYTMPLRAAQPVAVTLHDVTALTSPELHSPSKGPFLRAATRTALKRAALCIVPSAATRRELVDGLDADPARVHVAQHGVDRAVFHVPDAAEAARLQSRLGLAGQPYIAYLGVLEPRKNTAGLVRAYVRACAGRPQPPALVLAGAAGWDDDVDRAIAEVRAPLRVLRPGYLRVGDLAAYLGGCLLFAYPSVGEGFGLPVLEAMACGAPVLTTDRLALREVGGDAVAYAGTDVDDLAGALGALLDGDAERQRLSAAGRERAAGFSWERSAEQHLEAYAQAAAARV